MINVRVRQNDPCASYLGTARCAAVFGGGVDGNWNLTLSITPDTSDQLQIIFRNQDNSVIIAEAIFLLGADIGADIPISETNWVVEIQPYLTSWIAGDAQVGTFAKLTWGEDKGFEFGTAKTIEVEVYTLNSHQGCSSSPSVAGVMDVQSYNGSLQNPSHIVSNSAVVGAGDNVHTRFYNINSPNEGLDYEVTYDFPSGTYPGATGTITGIDLCRGVQILPTITNGRYDLLVCARIFGLIAGATDLSDRVTGLLLIFNGLDYVPELWHYSSLLSNPVRTIGFLNKFISGKPVFLHFQSNIFYHDGTQFQRSFMRMANAAQDFVASYDGQRFYWITGINGVLMMKQWFGSTDADYHNNNQWGGTVADGANSGLIVAGNNGGVATNPGATGLGIGIGLGNGFCLIGYDGDISLISGTLMMFAVLDSTLDRIIFLQEQVGTTDLIQISIGGLDFIDLTSLPGLSNEVSLAWDRVIKRLFIADGFSNLHEVNVDGAAPIWKNTLWLDAMPSIDLYTHKF